MLLSARNQLAATVVNIKEDGVMAEVTVQLTDGSEVVSVITAASVRRLQLTQGKAVTVVIKSTEVMLATDGATSD